MGGICIKKSTVMVTILLLITLGAVSVTIWALFFREPTKILAPDYAPQDKEAYAETILDDSDNKLDAPEGGGAVSLSYANQVAVELHSCNVSLFFANPSKSNQDIVLQIVIQDQVIVQSGTLSPGYQLKNLELLQEAGKMLSPGGYEGKFVVLYYNRETGEKAIVNTEIPVQITVLE